MAVHQTRKLGKTIKNATKTGTPIRHTRGVVVSSTIGQTTVTLDGGATNIQAFNYSHAQNLPADTVVDLLLVGKQAFILGAYDNDVPIGGLVAYATGPSSQEDKLAGAAASSVFTLAADLVAGHRYEVTFSVLSAQQVTAANTSGQAQIYATDSAALIPSTNLRAAALNAPPLSALLAGSASAVLTAASTATDTFTVMASDGSGGGGALRCFANGMTLRVTRVA